MINKKLVLLAMVSSFSYSSIVTLEKDNGKCMIIKSDKNKIDCSKKDSYDLDIDDTIQSSKVKPINFMYNTTSSLVFVSQISEDKYKVEKSLLTYLEFAYKNWKNPNKNSSPGGTLGSKVNISFLPSYTKVYYGENIKIEITSREKDVQYSLEDDNGIEIKLPKVVNNIILINTINLDKNRIYTLDIWSENNSQTITFDFLKEREDQIYKEYLNLNTKDKEKYREALFSELDLKLQ